MAVKIIAGHRNNTIVNNMAVSGSACRYLFSFLSKENKSNSKLCVLRASAVSAVLSKALSGSSFKPSFLGVAVEFRSNVLCAKKWMG